MTYRVSLTPSAGAAAGAGAAAVPSVPKVGVETLAITFPPKPELPPNAGVPVPPPNVNDAVTLLSAFLAAQVSV